MNKLTAINSLHRNICKSGLSHNEFFTISAIAEMTEGKGWVTTGEIEKFIGVSKQSKAIARLDWLVDHKIETNDRGHESKLFRLKAKAINLLTHALDFKPVKKDAWQRKPNKDKRK